MKIAKNCVPATNDTITMIHNEFFWFSLKFAYSTASLYVICLILRVGFGVNIENRAIIIFGSISAASVLINGISLAIARRNSETVKGEKRDFRGKRGETGETGSGETGSGE